MTVRITFTENARRFLHTTGERYPDAFGYLAGQVLRLYLNGHTTQEHLRAVLDALETELDGDSQ